MFKKLPVIFIVCLLSLSFRQATAQTPDSLQQSWIRFNILGYPEQGIKTAVWCTKTDELVKEVSLVRALSGQVVMKIPVSEDFGAYGPFRHTARINFSTFKTAGFYYLRAGNTETPIFRIDDSVYHGRADFCLRYMRQQRTGFNPSLNDSCHTHDGYTLYGPGKDSSYVDVVGGWHDASDYLQYSTTSANATWHLLAAYRDFRNVFTDEHQANGVTGRNGVADILDEAKWGLDWLLKMNPSKEIMFNQIGDDRDHMGMRIPRQDTNFYGRGIERPVYFVSGKPQQRGKFMNATNGVSSIAGKFSSAFALGARLTRINDPVYSVKMSFKAHEAFDFGLKYPGYSQTASVRSPYIYAEENWADDMELAAASIGLKAYARQYARMEPVTPWLGKDTASHYQWYPFVNPGHYELAKQLTGDVKNEIISFYKKGIDSVWEKARKNAFYRGVPFIWCSNNLTASFATQLYWYRQLSHDSSMAEFEQANVDWLLGCNPWGTSMVYGLPGFGDMPADPHSALTHIGKMKIDGGLVDGPVYTSIYKNLIGIQLYDADEYKDFQSDLAVYHDDYGDYSTNEPTMDGTASLIYLLAAKEYEVSITRYNVEQGAINRGDTSRKTLAIVFTADEYFEGLPVIIKSLKKENVKASFFFTGRMYRNKKAEPFIRKLVAQKQYLGPHSNDHLLYCDWNNRDSLLISRDSMSLDLTENFMAMNHYGINNMQSYFIPPYEWWNSQVADWCRSMGVQLINFTPGTRTNADYTWPEMGASYKSSEELLKYLFKTEQEKGLNGAILLIHAGTDPRRTDKLYNQLPVIIRYLKEKGYQLETVEGLLR
ncbi:MAG: glycoside hydrolase family 9 protein [Chitinophagaceae bacterium]|nr:glycoside hydrolase family 9 protein [Chitinophagaceae bacterium]